MKDGEKLEGPFEVVINPAHIEVGNHKDGQSFSLHFYSDEGQTQSFCVYLPRDAALAIMNSLKAKLERTEQ